MNNKRVGKEPAFAVAEKNCQNKKDVETALDFSNGWNCQYVQNCQIKKKLAHEQKRITHCMHTCFNDNFINGQQSLKKSIMVSDSIGVVSAIKCDIKCCGVTWVY